MSLVGPAHGFSEVALVYLGRQSAEHEVVAVHILTCTHESTLRTGARCPFTARLLDSANTDPMTACTCRRWMCLGATPTPGGRTRSDEDLVPTPRVGAGTGGWLDRRRRGASRVGQCWRRAPRPVGG
jgi:hypothetical protein